MPERNTVVGICESHAEAEACIGELRGTGFDPGKLSVAGREDRTGEPFVGRIPGERVTIPGIGRLVVSGPLAGWIAGAVEGAVVIGGLSTLGSALYRIGIPESSIIRYEAALEFGRHLVIAHGTAEEAAQAQYVMETAGAAQTAIHPYLAGRWGREGGGGLH